MGDMKFGLYLKKKGVITADELFAAIEYQQTQLPPIGQLAIEEGALSARQVFKVLRCQSGIPHERFGEVAVGMGMMQPAELNRLLMLQWQRKPSLSDVLVKLQILSPSEVDVELEEYRTAMERRNVVIHRYRPPAPHLDTDDEPMLSETELVLMMV
jgi:hypothetical protein